MYKDRNGKRIKAGTIVACVITVNHNAFRGFCFEACVCIKKGRALFLDGVHGWTRLDDRSREELCVIDADADMRKIECDFLRDFPRDY